MQHVFIIGSKSMGAYGGYETFVYKLTEYHQDNPNIKYHVACKANGCLLVTGRVSIMLMIVCIPYSGIHSRVGQRLTDERMIRPAGEWKSRNWDSYGIHSQGSLEDFLAYKTKMRDRMLTQRIA